VILGSVACRASGKIVTSISLSEKRDRWPPGGRIPWMSDERALRCKENVKNPTLTPQRVGRPDGCAARHRQLLPPAGA